jgi:hypothetical protein
MLSRVVVMKPAAVQKRSKVGTMVSPINEPTNLVLIFDPRIPWRRSKMSFTTLRITKKIKRTRRMILRLRIKYTRMLLESGSLPDVREK